MVKKQMSSGGVCPACGTSSCRTGWCAGICGLIIAVAGLLIIWPQGWFTFEHVLGLLVFLFGLKMLMMGFKR